MPYPGLCDKYGAVRTQLSAIFLPAASASFVAGVTGHSLRASILAGCILGSIGFMGACSAINAHVRKNEDLRNRQVGLSNGSTEFIKSQLSAYTKVVLSGTALAVSLLAIPGASLEKLLLHPQPSSASEKNKSIKLVEIKST